MIDDELKQYLDNMMLQINNQFEKLLNENKTFRASVTMLGQHVNLTQRVNKLEKQMRKRKG